MLAKIAYEASELKYPDYVLDEEPQYGYRETTPPSRFKAGLGILGGILGTAGGMVGGGALTRNVKSDALMNLAIGGGGVTGLIGGAGLGGYGGSKIDRAVYGTPKKVPNYSLEQINRYPDKQAPQSIMDEANYYDRMEHRMYSDAFDDYVDKERFRRDEQGLPSDWDDVYEDLRKQFGTDDSELVKRVALELNQDYLRADKTSAQKEASLTTLAGQYAFEKLAASLESSRRMREYYEQHPDEYQTAMKRQMQFKAELDQTNNQDEYNQVMRKYNVRF